MARTLIYGLAGQALVTDQAVADETLEVLVEAFGYATGLTVAHSVDRTQAELLMDEARQKIVRGVLMTEGTKPLIESRYHVRIGVTPDGQLTVTSDEAMERPPGSPANPYGE